MGTRGLSDLLAQAQAIELTQPGQALGLIQQALQLEPLSSRAWVSAALVYERMHRWRDAADCAAKVLELDGPATIRFDAANLLARSGQPELALKAAQLAFDDMGRPDAVAPMLLNICLTCADWTPAEALQGQLSRAQDAGCFATLLGEPRLNQLWCDDPTANLGINRAWAARNIRAPKSKTELARRSPVDGRRLCVGYLSSDFREHPTGWLVQGLLRHHDRQRFEVRLYDAGWDDGSDLRRALLSWADEVTSVSGLSDEAAANMMRGHSLDVLVDLNGPTRFNRLSILAQRVAPLQISGLGFHGSLGCPGVDAIFADQFTYRPKFNSSMEERVIFIEPTMLFNDYAARPQPSTMPRAFAGLPETAVVLGVFNAINKINRPMWQSWMNILKGHEDALLWVLDPGPAVQERLLNEALAAGANPGQLIWAPRLPQNQHLDRLGCCDLMLDTWPHGGHTTTADALFAGLPVLTRTGRNITSRLAGSLLHAAGLPELVADSLPAYQSIANRLLTQPRLLQQLRSRFRRNAADLPTFDAQRQTTCLEAAYLQLTR